MQNQLQSHCLGKGVYVAGLYFYQVSYFSGLCTSELVKARELTTVLRANVTGPGHEVRKLYLQIYSHIFFPIKHLLSILKIHIMPLFSLLSSIFRS